MITRKARLFLVKYTNKGDNLEHSYVYTNSEESAKNIIKECSNKHNNKHFFYEEIFTNY